MLSTVLILVLIIPEDWFLALGAKLYDTLSDLFDVGDGLIVHPVDHVVLKVCQMTTPSVKANAVGFGTYEVLKTEKPPRSLSSALQV